jgi:KaiC/GvpD/RAD55 family RecA-like ATPase
MKSNTIYIENNIFKLITTNNDPQLRQIIFDKWNPELFQNETIGKVLDFSREHYNQYGMIPTKDILLNSIDDTDLQDLFNETENLEDCPRKYLLDKITDYYKDQSIKKGLVESLPFIDSGNRDRLWPKFDELRNLESFALSGSDFSYFLNGPTWNQIEFGDIEYYLNPIIPENSITFLCGEAGIGKTIFLMSECDAISKGHDFGPWKNELGPQRVLYIDGEMPQKLNQRNTKQLDINENFYNYCRAYVYSQTENRRLLLTEPTWREEIRRFIELHDIKLVVFDNLASLASGIDENSKQDFDPLNQYFISLRMMGVSVIFAHHPGKSGDQRGTKSREDAADNVIYLKKTSDWKQEDGARFNLCFRKFRGVIEDKELIRTRELWYQKNARGQWEWTFDRTDLSEDPEFVIDLAVNGMSYDNLAEKFRRSKTTITEAVNKLVQNDIVKIEGSTRNQTKVLTEKGQERLGYPVLMEN